MRRSPVTVYSAAEAGTDGIIADSITAGKIKNTVISGERIIIQGIIFRLNGRNPVISVNNHNMNQPWPRNGCGSEIVSEKETGRINVSTWIFSALPSHIREEELLEFKILNYYFSMGYRCKVPPGALLPAARGEKPNNWTLGPKGLKSRQTQFQRHDQTNRYFF